MKKLELNLRLCCADSLWEVNSLIGSYWKSSYMIR